MKEKTRQRLRQLGLLAVIRAPSRATALPIVQALVEGGVSGIELTFSTPDALEVVAQLAGAYGDQILLGMGTLTRPEQAIAALQAGAQFLVSPVHEPSLLKAMQDSGLLCIPGALTPHEVFSAWQLGGDLVKVFPSNFFGPAYLKTLRTLFPEIGLIPTGGVTPANLAEWFTAGALAVAAGGELCPPALALQGDFSEITRRARQYTQAVAQALQR